MTKSLLTCALAAASLSLAAGAGAQVTTLNGAGATFPAPLYTKWFAEYQKVDAKTQFNYQAIGSGGGQKQILAQTVDFGASDGPMKDADLAKAPGKILHLPTAAGAVVVSYNLPGGPALKFDGETLAGIFLGTIAKWNDPAIAKLNAGITLPDLAIISVHRADGSGTNYIFTDYLSSVSADFKSKVGVSTTVEWPGGVGAKGNDGVAGQIKQTPGAIGYVELIYALQNKMAFGDLKNKDGEFVKASIDSVTAALATATIPDDFRFSMVNAPGKTSYPIAGATWLLVYQEQKDASRGQKLVDFLKWYVSKGADSAKGLDYAPLPENVRGRVLKAIEGIKVAK